MNWRFAATGEGHTGQTSCEYPQIVAYFNISDLLDSGEPGGDSHTNRRGDARHASYGL